MPASKLASCTVCHGTDVLWQEFGGLRRIACKLCHHSQREDIPDYNYNTFAMGSTANSDEQLQSQLNFLSPYVACNARVLELGCAFGDFAKKFRAQFSPAQYDAIEFSPAKDQAAQVVDALFCEPLGALISGGAVAAGSYQIVIASHCIEHIADVNSLIGQVRLVLSANGVVFIEVPNRSGHAHLPFDDNRTHLHFFCASSMSRLLVAHGFEVLALQTGAFYDARYSDSLRVVARPFTGESLGRPEYLVSNSPLLHGVDSVIVWSAGKMVDEVLEHYFDPLRIAFFVDADISKHGSLRMGREVRSPDAINQQQQQAVVIVNSLDFESSIRAQIERDFSKGDKIKKVIGIGELLASI